MKVGYNLNTNCLCFHLKEWERLLQYLFNPLWDQVSPERIKLQQRAKRVAELS